MFRRWLTALADRNGDGERVDFVIDETRGPTSFSAVLYA